MTSAYSSLSRAQLTYEYLHTNSTTHEFLFGALAELVDNSRDAEATELYVYTVPNEKFRGGFIICFRDNGCGMDAVEVSQVIQFGRSSKREAGSAQVGQYGNGLKSGTMRIGKDMMLFTKKDKTMSCLFLSRTFHEIEDIHEVIVPMPSWNVDTREPFIAEGHSIERHEVEMSIIMKYSPFTSVDDILKEFDKIPVKGTSVMIYNLKLMDNNQPELDIKKDEKDIIMADPHSGEVYDIDENILPEKLSFRAYLSIIYCEPRMKIYIQGEKVRTKKLVHTLYKPRTYIYTSNRFKKRSEIEAENAESAAKIAEERAKELTTQAREANSKYNPATKDGRTAIQLAVSKADQAKFDAEVKKRIADAKRRSSKESKTLSFTFGFNIEKRRCDGIFIFNCNRLIKMYERVGLQTEGGMKGAGVIGVVDVPYLVLEPTHNKQDFADHKEYKHLLKSMADHLVQYWKDSKIENQGITKFWDDFGYTGQWRDDPSNDPKFKMKRLMSVPCLVQCNKCLKWRTLSFTRKMVNYEVPSNWCCSDNPDTIFSSCSKPEQKITVTTGRLLKEIKSLDDKRAEDVRKLQEKLALKQSELMKNQKDEIQNTPPSNRSISPKSKRKKSPSPVLEELPKRGRRQRSPSPEITENIKQKTPSSPKKSKRAKSPSPKNVKKTNSISPALKRGQKLKSPSPPRKKSPSPQRKKTSPTRKKSSSPPRKKSPSPPSIKVKKTPAKLDNKRKSDSNVNADVKNKKLDKINNDNSEDESLLTSTIYPINCRVEARMHNTWYVGSVVAYKKSGENTPLRVRVKFEKNPQDKFDKWFYETDDALRLYEPNLNSDQTLNSNASSKNVDEVSSPTTNVSDATSLGVEVASVDGSESVKGELLEKVTYLLSRCLCYFRAPDFKIPKKDILSLTPQQLRDFPLSTFFDDYERNIKKQLQATRENLNSKVDEADKKLKEAYLEKAHVEKELKESKQQVTKITKTLKELRQGVNVMLRSILNEDEKLDANDVSDNVDIYLKTIVDQINDTNTS